MFLLRRIVLVPWLLALGAAPAFGQDAPETPAEPAEVGVPAGQATPGKKTKDAADAEAELQRALEEAGNDRAALLRLLEDYLRRFPEAPRKVQVYRALVEAAMQLRDTQRALDYAERIIALRPDEAAMMLFAADLLERAGDDQGLTRAVGYATRVLDRIEKAGAEGKPARVSQAEWEAQQKKAQMSLYLLRGRLQMARRDYQAAVSDLEASYRLLANGEAALHLGEIAELRKDYDKAIDYYLAAFALPDQYGLTVDRTAVRRKLGNLWQLTRGSETGLGDRLLEAYDRLALEPKTAALTERNPRPTGPFDFALRRVDGAAPVKLADWKGKVLVLNFWATWCLPCRELEPLFEQVHRQFQAHGDVVFLAVNGDEDESRVAPYLAKEKVHSTVVFADGLDRWLNIEAIPTVIVLDRAGKIIYRAQGFSPEGFVENLARAVERALAPPS